MRKKILVALIAAAIIGVGVFGAIPTLAAEAGPLDHVQIDPASVTLATGAKQQFAAQGYDAANQAISDLYYFWMATPGEGTINSKGVFTAPSVPGTYANAVRVVAVQGSAARFASATITVTSTVGVLDHIQVKPAAVKLVPNGTQQFVAQGYDSGDVAIANLTYAWSVVGASGSINSTGFFTAGAATGTFAKTVQASASKDGVTKTGTASVTIADSSTLPSQTYIQKIAHIFSGFFNSRVFNNLLNGQLQIKNGSAIDTVKMTPGVVQAVSDTSLTVLPNGQSENITFTLESSTVISPEGARLAVNDQVTVITINDRVSFVVKVTGTATSGQLPPGLRKQGDGERKGIEMPPGWFRGKKMGWCKNSGKHGINSESDLDD